ncbi:MAG: branched-chain amino acid ABC transporter permease [Firmicutes bacterium]|jgi:branched-chain amino acid transport system permease protein|nr:branched-chain amino acid ABC transporter permease [Bacillota bacterium]
MNQRSRHEWRSLAIVIGLLAVLPLLTKNVNVHHVIVMFFIYASLGEAWNMITGLAGQTSFGHASFFGIGAYAAAVAFYRFGASPWIGMVIGALAAAAVGAIVSYPMFRLRGHYFAVATLAVSEIVFQLFVSWRWVEGATGISVPVAREGLWTLQFHSSKLPYCYLALAGFVAAAAAFHWLANSRIGFYLRAIKDSEEAAMAIGINPAKYKLLAMVSSASLTAIFGSIYTQYILYIDPFMVFSMHVSIKIVLLTVLGGLGSVWGPVFGAAVLIPLSEYTRVLFGGTGRGIDLILFGVLIVMVACFQPQGIVGILRSRGRSGKGGQTRDAKAAA